MSDLKRFESFAMLAQLKSFTQTAQRLGTTRSKVSRHLAELESELQVRLLNRSTRSVMLTEIGRIYAQDCQHILATVEIAKLRVLEQQGSVRGKLCIHAPSGLGNQVLAPLWGAFSLQYPDVSLDVHLHTDSSRPSSQHVFDLAIYMGTLEDSSLTAQVLKRCEMAMFASPSYLANHEAIAHPHDLKTHRLLEYANPDSDETWRLYDANKKPFWTPPNPTGAVMRSNSIEACIAQAMAGYGVVYAPNYLALPHLASGALTQVLPAYTGRELNISLLYHSRRHVSKTLQTMIDFLKQSFKG